MAPRIHLQAPWRDVTAWPRATVQMLLGTMMGSCAVSRSKRGRSNLAAMEPAMVALRSLLLMQALTCAPARRRHRNGRYRAWATPKSGTPYSRHRAGQALHAHDRPGSTLFHPQAPPAPDETEWDGCGAAVTHRTCCSLQLPQSTPPPASPPGAVLRLHSLVSSSSRAFLLRSRISPSLILSLASVQQQASSLRDSASLQLLLTNLLPRTQQQPTEAPPAPNHHAAGSQCPPATKLRRQIPNPAIPGCVAAHSHPIDKATTPRSQARRAVRRIAAERRGPCALSLIPCPPPEI